MGAPRIMVLGGANVDTVATAAAGLGHGMRLGDSTPGRVRTSPGGVARNVAENLARLGHAVGLIAAVGDDAAGRTLLAATRQAGVDVSACAVLAGEATASYVSLHEPDGTLRAAVNDMQVLERLTPAVLAPHAAALHEAALWVVEANLSDSALAWVFSQHAAACSAAPVFADAVSAAKCMRLRPWLERVHTLKLNRLEAQALCGLPTATYAEVEAAANWLHARGVVNVVVSVGAEGLFFSASNAARRLGAPGRPAGQLSDERGWLPAFVMPGAVQGAVPGAVPSAVPSAAQVADARRAAPAVALNTNGAGDALMAALVHTHLVNPSQTAPLAHAARFASACAAITLTAPAANHPDLSPTLVAQWLASTATP
ncbi:MAG: hypothetical protein AD742_19375 [Methylibium sp. NZG]|nr:MAG: hypothetical protein AD742_19375 [Methylibium sp. NZG]